MPRRWEGFSATGKELRGQRKSQSILMWQLRGSRSHSPPRQEEDRGGVGPPGDSSTVTDQ